MNYLIGIDIGTSATKTVLFDENCRVIASASREYPLYQPQNGWAEQKPEDWRDAVTATLQAVVKKRRCRQRRSRALAFPGRCMDWSCWMKRTK